MPPRARIVNQFVIYTSSGDGICRLIGGLPKNDSEKDIKA